MKDSRILCEVCTDKRGVNLKTLEQAIVLGIEIAREGREGRKIGTIFMVSDHEKVMGISQSLILDPLFGHPDEMKSIFDPNMRETIKELAQLDGAFVIADDGITISACRYLNALSDGISLPLGLGARHMAAAAVSASTNAIGVVVSESSIVRVFDDGVLISELIPELWLFRKYSRRFSQASEQPEASSIVVAGVDE